MNKLEHMDKEVEKLMDSVYESLNDENLSKEEILSKLFSINGFTVEKILVK